VTRKQYTETLKRMKNLRLEMYEAKTRTEERRLEREYSRLQKIVRPYADGNVKFSAVGTKTPHSA
jgi:hypothetical protein